MNDTFNEGGAENFDISSDEGYDDEDDDVDMVPSASGPAAPLAASNTTR